MTLISIAIQIILFFLLSAIVAFPLAGVLYLLCKRKRKRKALFGMLSPFVFVFSFYFICLIGSSGCSSLFMTGCGMDGYWHADLPNGYEMESVEINIDHFNGDISKDGKRVAEWVTKVKISGDTIYGERYDVNEAPGSEYYFALDTETGELTQYTSSEEAKQACPAAVTGLTDVESFYYHSWNWVLPLGIAAFVISSGLVLLMWIVIVRNGSANSISMKGGRL